ncbi:hypothetical protein N7501_003354 [Penicillium viridicatum]|nr:hypothetical protein N7501_003354 [Penicillium viridicatum]
MTLPVVLETLITIYLAGTPALVIIAKALLTWNANSSRRRIRDLANSSRRRIRDLAISVTSSSSSPRPSGPSGLPNANPITAHGADVPEEALGGWILRV